MLTDPSKQSDPTPVRRRLPDERKAITHHFHIGDQEGYITVGMYEDGKPGELFIKMAKEGSTVSGLMDSFAIVFSLALQHGVELETLCDKLSHMRFEPSGWTGDPHIGFAKSISDYISRWLSLRFLSTDQEQAQLFEMPTRRSEKEPPSDAVRGLKEIVEVMDSPPCANCGSLMIRSGSCYRCMTCGSTSGCG
jgi:ribonucleoside-diphosphate reductase alpha chain